MPTIQLQPASLATLGPLAWNLLFYSTVQLAMVDPLLSPNSLAGAIAEPVTVTQFGVQSAGYWVMVVCAKTDPTSFAGNLALQYFPADRYLNFVNSRYIQDLNGLNISGFFTNGLPVDSQSGEATFQLINNLAATVSASPVLTNIIHDVWYLFGYPNSQEQVANLGVISAVINNVGGTFQFVTVFTASRLAGAPLVQQSGVWVLARIPTVLEDSGLVLDANMINDGFMRFIYDATQKAIVISQFRIASQLEIFDSNGNMIFNGSPLPAGPPAAPIGNPQDSNAYVPGGLHFDGATGLVTTNPLVTKNTGQISFAGWFQVDSSLSGTLEFSQGNNGNGQLIYDTSLPAPTWCHLMGSVDAAANQSVLILNGEVASGGPKALVATFSSAPTNGTNLYIGTDTQGNFFKGDIADLSIWFDHSFIQNGVITQQTIAKFVLLNRDPIFSITTIQPVNPAFALFGFNSMKQPYQQNVDNNLSMLRQPDIFLGGPASTALTPQTRTGTILQNIHTLTTVSGALTNSSTSPGTITITPV